MRKFKAVTQRRRMQLGKKERPEGFSWNGCRGNPGVELQNIYYSSREILIFSSQVNRTRAKREFRLDDHLSAQTMLETTTLC